MPSQASQMARMARTSSRRRAAGRDQGIEYLRSMCGRTWVPSPRVNRPADTSCRSRPTVASNMGVRAKAMAMAVPRRRVVVRSAASTSGRNGSWRVS